MTSMASVASMPVYMMPGVSVVQPPHLEGDPSLATEILPGPPPLLSTQLPAQKRDPRKPSSAYSYLPASDPGSTYSGFMAGTLIGQEVVEGPRTKRARLDKGRTATGRAQRASARHLNSAVPAVDLSILNEPGSSTAAHDIPDSDPVTMVVDDEPSISRSNSGVNLQEVAPAATPGRSRASRRDKGKGKETEPFVRVKEEPRMISLSHNSPEPPHTLVNEDHCSACRSQGALVYCDGCPKAFHLWCLDPPMEASDLPEGDSRWFCPSCSIRNNPPRKPTPSIISPLIQHLQTNIPTEYQLPDDIRTFFKDVVSSTRGTYVDGSEIKQPRLNRLGQLEDRDAYRLRDRTGAPILCFRCGTSALPGGVAAAAPAAKRARGSSSKGKSPEIWKSIVSCDYCNLHWHLDCLDPPLSTMPPFSKKWMCPNHSDQVLHPKRRIPKHNAAPIEITKARQFNNGNIEIIHPETAPRNAPKVAVDEVLINGRRYRVPERVIVLDFWGKVNKVPHNRQRRDSDAASGMSSPLTSLSSLEDIDEAIPHIPDTPLHDADDLKVAQLLCNLRLAHASNLNYSSSVTFNKRNLVESGIQTEPEGAIPPEQRKATRAVKSVVVKRAPRKANAANGRGQAVGSISAPAGTSATVRRRRAAKDLPPPEQSSRELRSGSKTNADSSLTSISSKVLHLRPQSSSRPTEETGHENLLLNGSMAAPAQPASLVTRSKTSYIKLEEVEIGHALVNGSAEASPALAKPRRTRVRRVVQKDPEENVKEEKPKRTRKRKVREDEGDSDWAVELKDEVSTGRKGKERKEADESETKKKKILHPPKIAPVAPSAALPISHTSAPATPSLKIRLPRLTNGSLQSSSSGTISTQLPTYDAATRR